MAGSCAVAALLASCAHTVKVNVDSLASPAAADAVSYRILNRTTAEGDSLRYQEAEKAVKRALAGKGLYEAPDPAKADLVINLDYGISEPRTVEEERSEPIYRTIPGRVYTEVVPVGRTAAGQIIYQTVLIQEPSSREYVGDRNYVVRRVVYDKYLRLSARENQPASGDVMPQEVWTVDVSSEGESANLRKYLPILAASTIEYIGKDTSGVKTVKIKDEDEDGAVAFVKKGM